MQKRTSAGPILCTHIPMHAQLLHMEVMHARTISARSGPMQRANEWRMRGATAGTGETTTAVWTRDLHGSSNSHACPAAVVDAHRHMARHVVSAHQTVSRTLVKKLARCSGLFGMP